MLGYRNHEGYADPTACMALNRILRENRFVYICSPYRDNPRVNVMRARQYCRYAISRGRIPLAPHLYFPQFISEVTEREKAMAMNFELLKLCKETWVFGDRITEGMAEEIRRSKVVRYFSASCEEVPG